MAVVSDFLLLVGACWLLSLPVRALLTYRPAGRRHRRGGYIRPSLNASGTTNPTTASPRATSTGWLTDGQTQAARAGRAMRRERSRTTGPIASGRNTAISLGAPTTVVTGLESAIARWYAPGAVGTGPLSFTSPASVVWPDGVTRFYDAGPDTAA